MSSMHNTNSVDVKNLEKLLSSASIKCLISWNSSLIITIIEYER